MREPVYFHMTQNLQYMIELIVLVISIVFPLQNKSSTVGYASIYRQINRLMRAVLKCAWRCNYVLCKVNILQTCLHDLRTQVHAMYKVLQHYCSFT